jgi:carbamoyltransferase
MKILGIQDGHSASAALVEDGVVVAAVQEERLTRRKNDGEARPRLRPAVD